MYRPLIPFLKPVDRLLQFCLPVSPRRACYLSRPDYCDNAYYVYKHIVTSRNNVEHVWSLMDMSLADRVEREFRQLTERAGTSGHTLKIVSRGSLMSYFLFLTSRAVFHTHGVYPISDRAYRREIVSLWHGMPIKCIGKLNHTSPRQTPVFGSLHIASSHFFRYVMACAFDVPADSVLVSGLPRCDALRQVPGPESLHADIRARLAVPNDSKLVLWLPTYRTEGIRAVKKDALRSFLDDLEPWVAPELSKLCKRHNCTLLVKLHPRDPLNYTAVDIGTEGVRVLNNRDWRKHEIQLYDLIAASDAVISDVSSVLIDCLVADKPIGVVGFNPATYTRDLVFPMEALLASDRFQHLDSAEAAGKFFEEIINPTGRRRTDGDVSNWLYEEFTEMSAETIVRRAGL